LLLSTCTVSAAACRGHQHMPEPSATQDDILRSSVFQASARSALRPVTPRSSGSARCRTSALRAGAGAWYRSLRDGVAGGCGLRDGV